MDEVIIKKALDVMSESKKPLTVDELHNAIKNRDIVINKLELLDVLNEAVKSNIFEIDMTPFSASSDHSVRYKPGFKARQ